MNSNVVFFGYGLYAGGAETNALHLSNYLSKRNVNVHFALLKGIHESRTQYKQYYKKIISHYLFRKNIRLNPLLLPFYGIITFGWFLNLSISNNYGVFISIVEYVPSFLCAIIASILRKKSIVIVGDNLQRDLLSKKIVTRYVHFLLVKISLLLSTKIICVSHGLAHQITNDFKISPSKISVIHNGVPPCPKNLIPSPSHKIKRIAILGRLVKKKDHDLLIKSIWILSKTKTPPFECYIVGKGNEKTALRLLVKQYDLQKVVRFVGFIKNSPYKFLKQMDLFVFTSKYEGLGNVILEAMMCGLPIISMNCQFGPQEILANRNIYKKTSLQKIRYEKYGILVDGIENSPKNAYLLSSAIKHCLVNEELLTKYRVRSLMRSSSFTVEKMCLSYYRLILSLDVE
jgi:glycosyltransferase involved in cell wall biosynthesis